MNVSHSLHGGLHGGRPGIHCPVSQPIDSCSAGPSACLWKPPQVAQPVGSTWLSSLGLTAAGGLAALEAGTGAVVAARAGLGAGPDSEPGGPGTSALCGALARPAAPALAVGALEAGAGLDRKSTRLNSRHVEI